MALVAGGLWQQFLRLILINHLAVDLGTRVHFQQLVENIAAHARGRAQHQFLGRHHIAIHFAMHVNVGCTHIAVNSAAFVDID